MRSLMTMALRASFAQRLEKLDNPFHRGNGAGTATSNEIQNDPSKNGGASASP